LPGVTGEAERKTVGKGGGRAGCHGTRRGDFKLGKRPSEGKLWVLSKRRKGKGKSNRMKLSC